MPLMIRAIFAFLMLPFLVSLVVPFILYAIDPYISHSYFSWAWILIVAGCLLLLLTIVQFYTQGRGTLAPWDPPKALVTSGVFRYSRNPMYIGVLSIVAGWGCLWASPLIATYCVLLFIGFHLRVILHEEKWAERTFGEVWREYAKQTPRWLLK